MARDITHFRNGLATLALGAAGRNAAAEPAAALAPALVVGRRKAKDRPPPPGLIVGPVGT